MSHFGSHHRRLNVISGHISSRSSTSDDLGANHCNALTTDLPHASATGNPSSYSRVHGTVSTDPVQWKQIESVAGKSLQEVIYRKSEGEGIAMVCMHHIRLVVDAF